MLLILFIPFIVNAETCDTNKFSIKFITKGEKSDDVEEIEEPTISEKKSL